jgi:hypothetical protein
VTDSLNWVISNTLGRVLLALLGSVLILVLFVRIASFTTELILSRKLQRRGRITTWAEALHQTREGHGVFVIHHGMLWWLEGEVIDKGAEVYIATERRGFLVRSRPKGKLRELMEKEAPGRFKIVNTIPFVDPAP